MQLLVSPALSSVAHAGIGAFFCKRRPKKHVNLHGKNETTPRNPVKTGTKSHTLTYTFCAPKRPAWPAWQNAQPDARDGLKNPWGPYQCRGPCFWHRWTQAHARDTVDHFGAVIAGCKYPRIYHRDHGRLELQH